VKADDYLTSISNEENFYLNDKMSVSNILIKSTILNYSLYIKLFRNKPEHSNKIC